MKSCKLAFSLLIATISLVVVNAQTSLKMGATGGPAGNGPLTTGQTVTLTDAGTNALSTTTVTYSLSNQQFGPGLVEGLPSNSAMNFGGSGATANSPLGGGALYSLMNGISSPTNSLFTSCYACAVGTGIDVTVDRSISLFNTTDALITSATVNKVPLNSRVYYGDMTLTFNRPVSNPILHFVGMGGVVSFTSSTSTVYDMGFATEFDLVGTSVSLSKISGNPYLNVSPTSITNSATYLGASSVGTATNGVTRYAATGTVVALGNNITSITFKPAFRT